MAGHLSSVWVRLTLWVATLLYLTPSQSSSFWMYYVSIQPSATGYRLFILTSHKVLLGRQGRAETHCHIVYTSTTRQNL